MISSLFVAALCGLVVGVVLALWWASGQRAPQATREQISEDRRRADSITGPLLEQANREVSARPRLRAVSSPPNLKGSK